ncbi:MAG: hypothetical protein QNI84_13240 [Henriciella sp.]|nr:hypothetical protein [Henriciella sp.]
MVSPTLTPQGQARLINEYIALFGGALENGMHPFELAFSVIGALRMASEDHMVEGDSMLMERALIYGWQKAGSGGEDG